MKKCLFLCLFFLNFSCFAFAPTSADQFKTDCIKVNPWPASSEQTFCDQFEESAYCHCGTQLPYDYCKNVQKMAGIYKMMMDRYGDIKTACKIGQDDIPAAMCVDQWNYYKTTSCKKIP